MAGKQPRAIVSVLHRNLTGLPEENQEMYHKEYSAPGPSFEPGTNRIQSRNTDSSTAMFYRFWQSLFPSGCLLMHI